MNKYFLIGVYTDKSREEESRLINIVTSEDDKEAFDELDNFIWISHKADLEEFDLIFLLSEDLKIVARASSSTSVDDLRMAISDYGDLEDYSPVYIDIAEHDERVLLSDILEVDLV